MGGFFGVVSKSDCLSDLFYGTDYHSHLGNIRGGMLTFGHAGMRRIIHDISNEPFRSKFEEELHEFYGATSGIGCISDTGDQPVVIHSHLGMFASVMVGAIPNLEELKKEAFQDPNTHFSEVLQEDVNPNELIASLIASGKNIPDGIRKMHDHIHGGSCSMLLINREGLYAIRDAMGRTPLVIGRKEDSYAAALEPCSLLNLNFEIVKELGPGEAVFLTPDKCKQVIPPRKTMKMCTFFWVYYGFPASTYEGQNVELVRYRCGKALADADKKAHWKADVDAVAGVPDSGVGHALGYAQASKIPYSRPFMKYTPTWARSFIPRNQAHRAHVASMKLLPIEELIRGKNLLFCDDSIVRGTQLGNTFGRLSQRGVKDVHVRLACPPILFNCKYINFSRSNGLHGLAARRAIARVEGHAPFASSAEEDAWLNSIDITDYLNPKSQKYRRMVEEIRKEQNLSSLRFQTLDDLVKAIGVPKEKLCTYCWDGNDCCGCAKCKHSNKKG